MNKDQFRIPVSYGPEDNPEQFRIDLWEKFNIHIGKGAINPSDAIENVSSSYPGYPYQKTDRTTMPSHYQCMDSISVVEYSGSIASMAIIHFRDTKDNHHQTWLWWRDFKGNFDSTKLVPGHQIEPQKNIEMKIVTESSTIRVTIPRFSL